MLPLWIIDITKKSDRRDAFLHLLGKMEHVFICDNTKDSSNATQQEKANIDIKNIVANNIANDAGNTEKIVLDSSTITPIPQAEDVPAEVFKAQTVEEKLEEEEIENAAREAVIRGNYWYYSSFDYDTYFKSQKEENNETKKEEQIQDEEDAQIVKVANNLYQFQEALVKSGRDFIMTLRKSNVRPYQPVNIVVLGDVTEELTLLAFSSIAAILLKEKGRFLPAHIHQGMSIYGMLYIPCDVNTYEVANRYKVFRLLNEIEVQRNITAVRGYDHMILYQNVQNRTECVYPMLSEEQQAEYMLQCLVHLFLACDNNHPLLSGTSSEDAFYISMGAASVYFDMTIEDEKDANTVASEIIKNFKEDGDNEKTDQEIDLVQKDLYAADVFVKAINVESFDLEDIKQPELKPHPINDFLHKYLKKQYYLYRLRYFPAELLREILKKIEDATSNCLDEISAHCVRTLKSSEISILPAITRIISKVNKHDGVLPFIENKFKDLEEHISKEKEDIQRAIERNFWHKIIYDTQIIPKKNKDFFEDYHDVYNNDIKSKNNGAGCKQMRDEALINLKALLSNERTLLSTIARCFLLGLMFVLTLLPLFDFISPQIINLGNVHDNAFWWAIGLFVLPLCIQYFSYLLYMRTQKRLIRMLKAYYMHDAYARLANRIEYEAIEYYDKMIALCNEYLNRCKQIRKEVEFKTPLPDLDLLFPNSKFNQPLNGGQFNGDVLIPDSEIEGSRIKVNYVPYYVNDLSKSNYFQLINHFNDELAILFQGVSLVENHARRFNEAIGDYEFVNHEELLKEKQMEWENVKQLFHQSLLKSVKDEMMPREFPTIGEKIIQYKKKIDTLKLLEPMLLYTATNGELTSEADTEYADIKVNRDIDDLTTRYLPLYTTRSQVSKYDELYKKYLFITRWRCFDHFSFNRLLPKEDFDQNMREERVYTEELKAKEREKEGKKLGKKKEKEEPTSVVKDTLYETHLSSLILWATCPDENSSEWLKLFDAEIFSKAYKDRWTFRKILNIND